MTEMTKSAATDAAQDHKGKFPNHQREELSKPDPDHHNSVDGVTSGGAHYELPGSDLSAQIARSAEGLVKAEVNKQTERGATDLSEVANALRQTNKGLEHNVVAPYVQKAADQIDRVSRFLRTADPKDMMTAVETFAKREPLLFLGGAFAVGLLGARFIKSSSHGTVPAAGTPMSGNRSSSAQMGAALSSSKASAAVTRS